MNFEESSKIVLRIQDLEERLRKAMLQSDISVLDELISPELIFTSHFGQIISKEDDLAFHRSGALKLCKLTPSDQRILIKHDVAIVSVLMRLEGQFGGTDINEQLRYTRVWSIYPDTPSQIIAGHASAVT